MNKAMIRDIIKNRNFRLLWIGEGVSLLGDQLYLIALPWLVLQLTGNALSMGTVLALAAVPRALFMLLGGALTDRLSPRLMMLGSNTGRMLLVGLLAAVTLGGIVHMWMLYAFALLFGLADAFFYPAQTAIVPRLLSKDHLQAGNALIQGTAQLSVFLGPAIAGALIALLDGSGAGSVPDRWGIGTAFALDAASFVASVAALALMRLKRVGPAVAEGAEQRGVASLMAEGLSSVWKDRLLRYYFLLIAAANLLITGPIAVGIPVLADTRYAGGAAAFGIILSAFGGGSLMGIILAGATRRPGARLFSGLMLGLTGLMGFCLVVLGLLPSTIPAAGVAVIMGTAQGYVVIQFVTWLQLRTPAEMIGRMMGLLMFSVVGMTPVSTAAAGALIQMSATAVFIGAGILMVLVVTIGALSPSVWRLGDDPADTTSPAHREALPLTGQVARRKTPQRGTRRLSRQPIRQSVSGETLC